MHNRIFGIVLVLIAAFIAADTVFDIANAGWTFRDGLILIVALLIAVRGAMRFAKN